MMNMTAIANIIERANAILAAPDEDFRIERKPAPAPKAAVKAAPADLGDILRRIRRIPPAERMAEQSFIKLAVVRRHLADVASADLERALLALQKKGDVILYPIDITAFITPQDRESVMYVAGCERHIVVLR